MKESSSQSLSNVVKILAHPMKSVRRLPGRIIDKLWSIFPRAAIKWEALAWADAGFSLPAPWSIKMAVLDRYKIPGAVFIETGTLYGDTTRYLAQEAPRVVSLEPMKSLFLSSKDRLSDLQNVILINKSSEDGFKEAIAKAESEDLCFWLDGHFSRENTFDGGRDTPIIFELETIAEDYRNGRIHNAIVFVDDVRLFVQQYRELPDSPARDGYPPLFWLASWAENLGFSWFIEHDIFIARSPR
jgi:hypothetical protein